MDLNTAIDVIESVAGFTDPDTSVGEAWAVVMAQLKAAPVPGDHGVLPMIISETGAADEPELERITCAWISGGADYVSNMPRELCLERITPNGSTFARYIHTDADTHTDGRPAPVPVAVSDRLPQPEDCDAEGMCWFFSFPFDYSRASWSLEDRTYGCNTGFTHWLPFNALPIPNEDPQP